MNKITPLQAIRGMNDCLPPETACWQHIENILKTTAEQYGYQEIRLPLIEKTALFSRSIGEATDIVEKEMYTFLDRNEESLTLRPEGTAGCVRACIEHGLLYHQIQRFYYSGPMFRYERPQKGRYRQFHQFGVEAFGMEVPELDAEVIAMTARFWEKLGLNETVTLHLNSLGSSESRQHYRQKLVAYFEKHLNVLDEDSQRRLSTNPLRILDSKNPAMQSLILDAPQFTAELDEASENHFQALQEQLTALKIPFILNPRLVRGLDYYNRTVFEWMTHDARAQNTICAGGRYDGLVEELGGTPTPAFGFALGIERLVSLIQPHFAPRQKGKIYLIMSGTVAKQQGMVLAERLRRELPSLELVTDLMEGGFKSQFKRADKSEADFALILGDEESSTHTISLKNLRERTEQKRFSLEQLIQFLQVYDGKHVSQ